MSTFLELDTQYKQVNRQMEDLFNSIAQHLIHKLDELGYENSQYRTRWDELYESHTYHGNLVYITYTWTDPYEDLSSSSFLQLPIHWVDYFISHGTLPEDEVVRCLEVEKTLNDNREYEDTLRKAIALGIVKED
ncbi:hypothetical protein KUA24_164 [Vibrio phage HNL01]|nr:hypothetical protein KUA24_164 [Vibrio phage HNL01]